jgi:hypothetical protein
MKTAVEMVVDPLMQATFASYGSSVMCYAALWIVNYVDAVQMRDAQLFRHSRESLGAAT